MGYYIDPKTCTKEQWLSENGAPLSGPPEWTDPSTHLPVCLIDNRAFTAAGVAFSRSELSVFANPDGRSKRWFSVPIEKLYEVGALPKDFDLSELGR